MWQWVDHIWGVFFCGMLCGVFFTAIVQRIRGS